MAFITSFIDRILGRPLASREKKQQELSVLTGVAALGLDALASTAYGPEAALMILLPLGVTGLHYFLYVTLAVIAILITLYLSYQQTISAYPNGGGAYVVASENLGKRFGLCAAIALLLDYFLNVAVGISAGVGAVVSALPSLQPHTLALCLLVLFVLTILNLRGARDSGTIFVLPTVIFVLFIGFAMLWGLAHVVKTGGHPVPVVAPPPPPPLSEHLSLWLLLGAFANGLTAMTGIEAVSNAVPLFRKPPVRNAQWTMTLIVVILASFLLALGYLCPAYHIVAMDEYKPGYETILSQLVAAVMGKGVFYYISITSIFIILAYSAQTSFIGFPRVCRLLAEDNYLPHFFAERGRRLVFTYGIVTLALLSALILIAFDGITSRLIPLFAVGAFSAFLFSQTGMVIRWLRKKLNREILFKLAFNALGAVSTAIALVIIIASKFIAGAWVIILLAPALVLLCVQINLHYRRLSRQVETPLELQINKLKSPIVVIPISGWDRVSEMAVRFGMLLSDDVMAVYISTEDDSEEVRELKKNWKEKVLDPVKKTEFTTPALRIIRSPYRQICQPILDLVKELKKDETDRLIAVVIPELVEAHLYERILHNINAAVLRTMLFLERDQRTVVISTPWYLREPKK